jgi:predicted deacylase
MLLNGPIAAVRLNRRLALASFEAWVHLVDDVNPAFTAHQTVCAVTAFQGF